MARTLTGPPLTDAEIEKMAVQENPDIGELTRTTFVKLKGRPTVPVHQESNGGASYLVAFRVSFRTTCLFESTDLPSVLGLVAELHSNRECTQDVTVAGMYNPQNRRLNVGYVKTKYGLPLRDDRYL